jgi:hypothetical protein
MKSEAENDMKAEFLKTSNDDLGLCGKGTCLVILDSAAIILPLQVIDHYSGTFLFCNFFLMFFFGCVHP